MNEQETNMQEERKNCSCERFFFLQQRFKYVNMQTFVTDDMRLVIHRNSTRLHCQSVEPILMIALLPCTPNKHSLMHSSTQQPQFIFI